MAPGTGPREVWCNAYVNELKEAELLVLHALNSIQALPDLFIALAWISPGCDCIFAKLEHNIECFTDPFCKIWVCR